MTTTILKNTAALLFFAAAAISCNSKTESTEGTGLGTENTNSLDASSENENAATQADTAKLQNVDASRMSGGKDSVSGEITPPNAQEQ